MVVVDFSPSYDPSGRGKVGDLSFYKDRNNEYRARMKGGVDADRIATDPNFQRTRENMAEFGRADRTAKALRHQLNNLMLTFGDRRMPNRLTSLVHRIQKADAVNLRGERVFQQENSGMLRGFEFNASARLGGLFSGELAATYDRVDGVAELEIPAFNPLNAITLLPDATHIQFVLAAAELDLECEFPARPVVEESGYIPVIGLYPGATLTVDLPADPGKSVYLLLGIAVYQEVNGQYYSLNNGQYNALTIAAVDVV